MTTRTTKTAGVRIAKVPEHNDPAAVRSFLAALDHPLKPVVESIRDTILGADDRITEGIKWNSASYYCHGWFATINLRGAHGVLVVLHHGAKARPDSELSLSIKDPGQLLTWPSRDRAQTSFASSDDYWITPVGFVLGEAPPQAVRGELDAKSVRPPDWSVNVHKEHNFLSPS